MRIKIDKADSEFSIYIRTRDRRCLCCKSPVQFNDEGKPITHQCSHYFGRGNENTRFDPENCDTLCFACHQDWGSKDREAYREFKVKQLGEKGFKNLRIRANMLIRKDRKLALIFVRELNKKLKEERAVEN